MGQVGELQCPPDKSVVRREQGPGVYTLRSTYAGRNGDRRAQAGGGRERLRIAAIRVLIRIDAMWLAIEPVGMRAGIDTLLARLVKVFAPVTFSELAPLVFAHLLDRVQGSELDLSLWGCRVRLPLLLSKLFLHAFPN
ncbi:hypothetical protein [Caballeronia telluris]|uniref:Transposase n=1 Tax=Caballeronia telluris TaxID=326475 RepID=A0A158JYW3_9BURK|nr:hypothetical protein [Caballeronia telluris]SAL74067.1 transposase [Caballeronia telluris]